MKLADIRSAEPIEDVEKAFDRLQTQAKRRAKRGVNPHTTWTLDESGQIRGKKTTGKANVAKAGKTSRAQLEALMQARGMPFDEKFIGRDQPYRASDSRVDSHGDIVLQDWDFTEFGDNSPLAFSHEWGGLPVGRVLDWDVKDSPHGQYRGLGLHLLGLFMDADTYPFADTVHRMVKGGFFPAGSVGFFCEQVIDVKDPEERSELGLAEDYGYVLADNHLLEFSPTMLGANSGALTVLNGMKSRGLLLAASDIDVVRELERRNALAAGRQDEWKDIDEKYRRLARHIFPKSALEAHKDVEEEITLDGTKELSTQVTGVDPDDLAARLLVVEGQLDVVLEEQTAAKTAIEDVRTLLEDLVMRGPGPKEDDEEMDDDEESKSPDDEEMDDEDKDDEEESKSKVHSFHEALMKSGGASDLLRKLEERQA